MVQFGTHLAKEEADGINQQGQEIQMTYRRYDDRYWEQRLNQSLRGRSGFAWGAFFIGFIIGGIIF